MRAIVEVPKAFSARGENEIAPIQHLMERLNPQLIVKQVATAVHVDGGGTVLWGLVCLEGQPLSKEDIDTALRDAGFDFEHSDLAQAANLCAKPSRGGRRSREYVSKADREQKMKELETKRDAARAKLAEVGRSSAEAWTDVRKGAQSAYDELDKAFRDARVVNLFLRTRS